MSLIVEDGSGLSTAESYCSVADATTYIDNFGTDATWSALSTTEQEVCLRKATRYLEGKYHGRWIGERRVTTQKLAWPRVGARDVDDILLPYNELPDELVEATAELARKAASEDIMPDVDEPGAVISESVSIGPISESKSYQSGKIEYKRYSVVDRLVRRLVGAIGLERA